MPWPRRKLVTILDSGTILGGTGPGGGDILPILDGLGVWYKADDGASSSFAAQFTKANQEYLTIPSNSTLRLGNIPWTMGGWFWVDAISVEADVFIAKRTGASIDYQLFLDVATNNVTLGAFNGSTYPLAVLPPPTAGAWHFVIGSFDPAGGGILSIQIDGGSIANSSVTGLLVDNSTGMVNLGVDEPSTTSYVGGRMQNWFIFGRALSVAERAFLWNGGTGRRFEELTASFKTDLRAWWDLSETSGSRADRSGNGNTLTDNNTVTQAAGWVRNTPATGGPIQFWNDSGPNDFDLGQAAVGAQPTWIANERNGRAVARFAGGQAMVTGASILGSFLAGPQEQSVFFVMTSNGANNSAYSWSAGQLNAHLPYAGVLYYDTAYTNGRIQAVAPSTFPLTWHILEMIRDNATGSITLEGNALAAGVAGAAPTSTTTSAQFVLGTGPGGTLVGDVAEIIIYNRTLTTTERDSVRNYLKAKWGIAQNKVLLNTAQTGYVLINSTTNDRWAFN